MTAALLARLMAPWPQWRTHWNVWHAWPLGAQVLLLSVGSLCGVVAGSLWVSAEAWDQWWHAQDIWRQTQQDMDLLQRQVQQQRERIAKLQAQPHPAGFAIPAWQAWPDELTPDHRDVLQAWLHWGSSHGLVVQAFKTEEGKASGSWTGSLPSLLAAWHGLPGAVPRMAVTGFDIQTLLDPPSEPASPKAMQLQLQMQWVVLNERQHLSESASKPPSVWRVQSSSMVHDPFAATGLKKALPWVALPASVHDLSSWQTQSISDMRWAGMLANAHQRWALLQVQGQVQTIALGDRLGQDWGVVTGIERDHLRLREWVADAQGKWVSQARRFPAVDPP